MEQPNSRPPWPRPERRRLTDEELEALRELAHGRRTSNLGAWAAIIAAIATLISAVTAATIQVWSQISPK